MTKRDYIVIAEIIIDNQYTSNYSTIDTLELADFFADSLKRKNEKFDKPTFIEYIKRGIE